MSSSSFFWHKTKIRLENKKSDWGLVYLVQNELFKPVPNRTQSDQNDPNKPVPKWVILTHLNLSPIDRSACPRSSVSVADPIPLINRP
jgi:hypothetical protein